MQVTAYGQQTVSDSGVARSCDLSEKLKVSNLYTGRLYQF